MENINIRKATIDDADVIHRFLCELEEEELDAVAFKVYFSGNLNSPHAYHLVATTENEVIGFISAYGQAILHLCGIQYEIQELFVAKEYRNKLIGQKLLAAIEKEIGECKRIKVCTNVKRIDTHRFYERNGFTRTGYRFVKKRGEI